MYREGHVGAALLVFAPVGASVAMAGHEAYALLGAALMVVLAPVPDWDQRVPLMTHRGFTHTVGFALLLGGLLWAGLQFAASTISVGAQGPLGAFGFVVGALSVGAHVAADALTPAGVRPFWPLWGREFSLNVARASNPVANYALLTLGVLATALAFLVVMG